MQPRHLIAVTAFVTAFVVAACSTAAATPTPAAATPTPVPSASPTTYQILGTFTLIDASVTWSGPRDGDGYPVNGDACAGSGGYSDFGPAWTSWLTNEKGEVIGTAPTTPGPLTTMRSTGWWFVCEVDFAVPVPAAKFYSIEVGHRGTTTYSFDQLATSNWRVSLALGSK